MNCHVTTLTSHVESGKGTLCLVIVYFQLLRLQPRLQTLAVETLAEINQYLVLQEIISVREGYYYQNSSPTKGCVHIFSITYSRTHNQGTKPPIIQLFMERQRHKVSRVSTQNDYEGDLESTINSLRLSWLKRNLSTITVQFRHFKIFSKRSRCSIYF